MFLEDLLKQELFRKTLGRGLGVGGFLLGAVDSLSGLDLTNYALPIFSRLSFVVWLGPTRILNLFACATEKLFWEFAALYSPPSSNSSIVSQFLLASPIFVFLNSLL